MMVRIKFTWLEPMENGQTMGTDIGAACDSVLEIKNVKVASNFLIFIYSS
jgi:hypothetical protein